jgi:hypothetical protein
MVTVSWRPGPEMARTSGIGVRSMTATTGALCRPSSLRDDGGRGSRDGVDRVVRETALATEGSNHASTNGFCQGQRGRRHHLIDAHVLQGTPRIRSVSSVTIPDDEARRGVPRPRLAELLRGSRCGRMRRDVHVDDAASVVRQHHEHKQHAERGRGDREEIDRASSAT